jgi:hypothetical protein
VIQPKSKFNSGIPAEQEDAAIVLPKLLLLLHDYLSVGWEHRKGCLTGHSLYEECVDTNNLLDAAAPTWWCLSPKQPRQKRKAQRA